MHEMLINFSEILGAKFPSTFPWLLCGKNSPFRSMVLSREILIWKQAQFKINQQLQQECLGMIFCRILTGINKLIVVKFFPPL